MKNSLLFSGSAVLAALLFSGCGHLSLDTAGNPDRVLNGIVQFSDDRVVLPPGTEVRVSVVDETPPNPAVVDVATSSTMPTFNRQNAAAAAPGPEVLGEQTIRDPGTPPVAFRVEYTADDDRLRHGLAIQVRVSYGGSVRFFNATQYAVTLGDVTDVHRISVEPAR
jgi:uncharacterized lipoprotein YbaY